MQRPYLIAMASDCDGVDEFFSSLYRLEDSVELVFISFLPYFKPFRTYGISRARLISTGEKWRGNQYRWAYLPEDLDPDRYWIFTDVADVRFQGPVPDLDFYLGSVLTQYEGLTHADTPIWKDCIEHRFTQFKHLLPARVMNGGGWAAKGWDMKKFAKILLDSDPAIWDQLTFNDWLQYNHHQDCPELFGALYNNYYSGDLIKNGTVFHWAKHGGITPAIVHGNGCSKNVLD